MKLYDELNSYGLRLLYSSDGGVEYAVAVLDWQVFLPILGYNDEALVSIFNRWAWVEVIVTKNESRVLSFVEVPLPGSVGVEKFIEKFGSGDPFKDAALVALLSKYNASEILIECLRFVGRFMYSFYRQKARD